MLLDECVPRKLKRELTEHQVVFSFALVEMGFFQLPKEIGEGYLVHPRLVTRTVEIGRAVIRIEDGKLIVDMPPTPPTPGAKRTTITEQVFYENLDPKIAKALQEFFDKALSLESD